MRGKRWARGNARDGARIEGTNHMMRTSSAWWAATRADPARLHHWLQRQYLGEMAAVRLLSELLCRFGHDASADEWETIHRILCQEATHARWIKRLLDARGLRPAVDAHSD